MRLLLLLFLAILAGCGKQVPSDNSDTIVSMQIIDRNGMAETISNKDRLKPYQATDFLTPQPYQKALRVYGRNPTGQSASKITAYHDNGHISQYLEVVDGRAHGLYREWFSNGQLKIESHVIEGVADINEISQQSWVFDQKSKVWDDRGNLIAQFQYDKGFLNGQATYYYANGRIQKTIPYDQGMVHGSVEVFDEEGSLIETTTYVEGEKHGPSVARWDAAHLRCSELYDHDLLMNANYFDRDGKLIAKINDGNGKSAEIKNGHLHSLVSYEKGIPEGKIEIFRSDGTLRSFYHIKDGKKAGEEIEYYSSSPVPKISLNWQDDNLHGQVRTWYENGQMESQRDIYYNKKQGLCFGWYKNGDLMLSEEYENDLLIKASYYKKGDRTATSKIDAGKGIATLFSADGIFLKKVTYEKGKPTLNDDVLR